MDRHETSMDYRKIVPIADIIPVLNIANTNAGSGSIAWGPRTIDDFELILVRQGACTYRSAATGDIACPAGKLLIIPPGTEHTFIAPDADWAFSFIHCLPHGAYPWHTGLAALDPEPARLTDFSSELPYMEELFLRCGTQFNSYAPLGRDLAATGCREIWLRCAAAASGTPLHVSPRMQAMLAYIRSHIGIAMSRTILAEAFHLSPEYVSALFKQELGISTSACINREKVIHGCSLLCSRGLSVSETAYACGYSDPFYFSRVFKKVLGIPPEKLRGRRYFPRQG